MQRAGQFLGERTINHPLAGDLAAPAKAADSMVTLKWLSPPGFAPEWPACRPESSSISSRVGAKAEVSLCWMASNMAPIDVIFNS